MVILMATLKANEGKGDAVAEEFKKLVPKVLKDPGTLGYLVCRAVDDPNKFVVVEQYESREALGVHGQAEHFKAFNAATRGMFAGRAEVQFWNKVA
ncbi:MAG: putative quinol monooxygenase [Dehalococcoidales bacterium]|nr:putative quinol monooxygenase [Dehalococcoidales bacterium]